MNNRTNRMQTHIDCERREEHLCYIISQGFHLANEQSYAALITAPKFRCDHCGREADNNRNLCVPTKL